MVGVFAEPAFHTPLVGKGADVHAAAHRAAGPEGLRVAEREPQRAVAPHAETGDRTPGAVGFRPVMLVDVFDQFGSDECFVAVFRVGGAVPVPAVPAAIGADRDEFHIRGVLRELGPCLVYVGGVVAAVPVQQINDRIPLFRRLVVAGGQYHDAFDGFVHRRAQYGYRIYPLGEGCARAKQQRERQV